MTSSRFTSNRQTLKGTTYHRNVIAGAVLMLDPSINPVAPATIHPTAKPIIILIFFRKGDPNISVRIMLMNERNPMPMNSGEPQGKGRGASVVGHCWNMPLVGNFWHPFAPPPQFSAPEAPTRELPIKRTTVPVTYMYDKQLGAVGEKYVTLPVIIGGNNLFSVREGTKARNISKKEQTRAVPILEISVCFE